MMPFVLLFAFAMLLVFGVMKLPAERALSLQHRQRDSLPMS